MMKRPRPGSVCFALLPRTWTMCGKSYDEHTARGHGFVSKPTYKVHVPIDEINSYCWRVLDTAHLVLKSERASLVHSVAVSNDICKLCFRMWLFERERTRFLRSAA
jgi:hypothetical protein